MDISLFLCSIFILAQNFRVGLSSFFKPINILMWSFSPHHQIGPLESGAGGRQLVEAASCRWYPTDSCDGWILHKDTQIRRQESLNPKLSRICQARHPWGCTAQRQHLFLTHTEAPKRLVTALSPSPWISQLLWEAPRVLQRKESAVKRIYSLLLLYYCS